MLETIAIILIVLWLLGLVTSYTMGRSDSYPPGHRDHSDRGSFHPTPQPVARKAK